MALERIIFLNEESKMLNNSVGTVNMKKHSH